MHIRSTEMRRRLCSQRQAKRENVLTFWQSMHWIWHSASVLNVSIKLFPYPCIEPIRTPCRCWLLWWAVVWPWLCRILVRFGGGLVSVHTSVWPICMSSPIYLLLAVDNLTKKKLKFNVRHIWSHSINACHCCGGKKPWRMFCIFWFHFV